MPMHTACNKDEPQTSLIFPSTGSSVKSSTNKSVSVRRTNSYSACHVHVGPFKNFHDGGVFCIGRAFSAATSSSVTETPHDDDCNSSNDIGDDFSIGTPEATSTHDDGPSLSSPMTATSNAFGTVNIEDREKRLIENLRQAAEATNKSDCDDSLDVAKEFQSIINYHSRRLQSMLAPPLASSSSSGMIETSSSPPTKSKIRQAADKVYKWTHLMLVCCETRSEQNNDGPDSMVPVSVSLEDVPWNAIVEALALTRDPVYLKRAEELMERYLEYLQRTSSSNDAQIDNDNHETRIPVRCYSSLISGWAKCSAPPSKAINNRSRHNNGDRIKSGKQSRGTDPADHAERWMMRWLEHVNQLVVMQEGQDHQLGFLQNHKNPSSFLPNALLFGTVMDALAKSTTRGSDGALRAERLLDLIYHLNGQEKSITQTKQEKEEEWFEKELMEAKQHETRGWNRSFEALVQAIHGKNKGDSPGILIQPNTVLFTSVIDAWARSPHPQAAERAEAVLDRMEQEYFASRTGSHVKPNILSYTTVISAWARKASSMERSRSPPRGSNSRDGGRGDDHRQAHHHQQEPSPASRAEQVLLKALHFSSRASSSSSSIMAGEEAFDDAVDVSLYDLGERKEASQNNEEHEGLTLDVIVYNSVIGAWASAADQESKAAQKAEQWLQMLLPDEEEIVGHEDHNKSSGSEGGPRNVLRQQIRASGIVADTISFNSVINAYARVKGDVNSAKRAEYWFQRMRAQGAGTTGSSKPTSITYGSIIKAWSNTQSPDAPVRAQLWLRAYEKAAQMGELVPSVTTYNSVLLAWTMSGRDDAVEGASQLIKRMEQVWNHDADEEGAALVPPDIITYNTFLKGCSLMTTDRGSRASSLRIAFETFDRIGKLPQAPSPDAHMFVALLSCVKHLTETKAKSLSSYDQQIKHIFQACCDCGMVNKFVMSALKSACYGSKQQRQLFDELLGNPPRGDDNDAMKHIPHKWKRNAMPGGNKAVGRSHVPTTERSARESLQTKSDSRSHMQR
jgi:hypothetical protein